MSTFNQPVVKSDASIWPTAIKWGVISGAFSIVSTMLVYNMGMMDPENTSGSIISTLVTWAIGFALVFLGVKNYKNGSNNGELSLGTGVFWSLGYGIIAAIIGVIFSYIFFTFLAPDFVENMLELQVAEMEEQGMGEDEIETAQSMMGIFMNPFALAIFGALSSLFYSVIQGLIASLIQKTR